MPSSSPGPAQVAVAAIADTHGVLDDDLGFAALQALAIPPQRCRAHAVKHSWTACAEQFLANLHPIGSAPDPTSRAAQAA